MVVSTCNPSTWEVADGLGQWRDLASNNQGLGVQVGGGELAWHTLGSVAVGWACVKQQNTMVAAMWRKKRERCAKEELEVSPVLELAIRPRPPNIGYPGSLKTHPSWSPESIRLPSLKALFGRTAVTSGQSRVTSNGERSFKTSEIQAPVIWITP